MLAFGGYCDRQRSTQGVYLRARPTSVPSALHREEIVLVKREDVERFGAQRPKK
jgi:hypothetical protein